MRPLTTTTFTNAVMVGALAALPYTAPECEKTCSTDTTDILTEGGMDVGDLSVTIDGMNMVVTYEIKDLRYNLTGTHLYVSKYAPARWNWGDFDYKHLDVQGRTDTFIINLASIGATAKTPLYVAAHAEGEMMAGLGDPSIDDFNASLPDEPVTMTVSWPGGTGSYFETTISNGGALDGTWDGYCVDTDHEIEPGATYSAEVVSSYDPAIGQYGLVDFPENFDMVNWIMNQDYVGGRAMDMGTFTFGDVQRAYWTLLEDWVSTAGLGEWSQAHVDEIVQEATAWGQGFLPGCGEEVAVLLVPVDETGAVSSQVTFAQVEYSDMGVACPINIENKTAWADGDHDIAGTWGSWFEYKCW